MFNCPACASSEHKSSLWGRGQYRQFSYEWRNCLACGSSFIDPMPGLELFAYMYGPGYMQEHLAPRADKPFGELASEVTRTVEEITRRGRGGRVLDVGCGDGSFLLAAREAGLACEGLELTAATADLVQQATGIRVHAGDLTKLERTYDVIHLADVLEHHPCPTEMLLAAKSRLAPRGVVVARGPLEQQPSLFLAAMMLRKAMRLSKPPTVATPPYHVVHFTFRGWLALFRRSGFASVHQRVHELGPSTDDLPVVRRVIKRFSLILSNSHIGRRLKLGNRVVASFFPIDR